MLLANAPREAGLHGLWLNDLRRRYANGAYVDTAIGRVPLDIPTSPTSWRVMPSRRSETPLGS